MKKYSFLNGSEIVVEDTACRGCFLETEQNLPPELEPIWINDSFVIRQDAECPIPGFYIVSCRKHIHTIGDLSVQLSAELGIILNRLRILLARELQINRVHIILEERIVEPHLHIWMLPLWPEVMKKNSIDPKIWNSNIKEYISLFSYKENCSDILEYNKIMTLALKSDSVLMSLKCASNE